MTKDDKEQLLNKLQETLIRRISDNKYRYYEPIGKVEEFLNNFCSCRYKTSLISAANGVGKTTVEINIMAHLFWPCGNEYFQQKLFTDFPYDIKKCRIVSDPTTIRETIIPAMHDWFPKGRYKTKKMGKNYDYHWKTDSGWTIDVMTYDQDVKEFESSTLSLILFDEPPPQAIYKACVSRTRKGGILGIFATPLIGSAWMYDSIVANTQNEQDKRYWITAEMEDACIDHGVRGFLKHQDILDMIAQFDEEDLQARVFGRFQHLTGLVFKEYNEAVHTIEPFTINRKDFTVYQAYDPHPRNPDAILWMAVDRKGNKFIIDGLFIDAVEEEIAERILEKDERYQTFKRIGDPSMFVVDKHTGESLASRLEAKYKLTYEPGSKRRTDAVKRIRQSLHYVSKEGSSEIIKPPEVLIFSTCQRLRWEMLHWQWEDWRGRSAELKSPKEKPQDKDDHHIENLGRLLLLEPTHIPPREELVVDSSHTLDPYD